MSEAIDHERRRIPGRYEHRDINGRGVGHNLPQEASREFAEAIVRVDGFSRS